MATPVDPSDRSPQAQVEQDLLRAILTPDSQPYPWQPEDAASYLDRLAAAGEALSITEAEATQGWQALAAQLATLVPDLEGGTAGSVAEALAQRFGECLPPRLIEQISGQAQRVGLTAGQPLLEQLLACVREAFADWDEADLQVLARPLAYAMRGQPERLETALQASRSADWDSLSPLEQVRLGLAAAGYALDYLKRGQF
jgi:hypothetical protein